MRWFTRNNPRNPRKHPRCRVPHPQPPADRVGDNCSDVEDAGGRKYIQARAGKFSGRYLAGFNVGAPYWTAQIRQAMYLNELQAERALLMIDQMHAPEVWPLPTSKSNARKPRNLEGSR